MSSLEQVRLSGRAARATGMSGASCLFAPLHAANTWNPQSSRDLESYAILIAPTTGFEQTPLLHVVS